MKRSMRLPLTVKDIDDQVKVTIQQEEGSIAEWYLNLLVVEKRLIVPLLVD